MKTYIVWTLIGRYKLQGLSGPYFTGNGKFLTIGNNLIRSIFVLKVKEVK